MNLSYDILYFLTDPVVTIQLLMTTQYFSYIRKIIMIIVTSCFGRGRNVIKTTAFFLHLLKVVIYWFGIIHPMALIDYWLAHNYARGLHIYFEWVYIFFIIFVTTCINIITSQRVSALNLYLIITSLIGLYLLWKNFGG